MRLLAMCFCAVALTACGSEPSETEPLPFTYGATEMAALIVGSWSGPWTPTSGAPSTFTLEAARVNDQTSAAACGSRTFSASSVDPVPSPSREPACVSVSELALTGILSVADGSIAGLALNGALTVPSTNLVQAFLNLRATDGSTLLAEFLSERWDLCRVESPQGAILAQCALESRR
jgi:hypothetical protein